MYEQDDVLVDPHTAVGIGAARRELNASGRNIVMATAHPAKFPDAVEKATGIRPELPKHLSDLYEREERFEVLPNDLATVQEFVEAR